MSSLHQDLLVFNLCISKTAYVCLSQIAEVILDLFMNTELHLGDLVAF